MSIIQRIFSHLFDNISYIMLYQIILIGSLGILQTFKVCFWDVLKLSGSRHCDLKPSLGRLKMCQMFKSLDQNELIDHCEQVIHLTGETKDP